MSCNEQINKNWFNMAFFHWFWVEWKYFLGGGAQQLPKEGKKKLKK
jgi:hypothetical protein